MLVIEGLTTTADDTKMETANVILPRWLLMTGEATGPSTKRTRMKQSFFRDDTKQLRFPKSSWNINHILFVK